MDKETPKLSEGTIKRMKSMGLDPDEMSEEQLAALESLERPEKSHWLSKPFTYIGGFLELIALFSLFSADWGAVFGYGIVGLILSYIGYRIQANIAGRRFVEASIKKDMKKREKEVEKLWSRFQGMTNTDDVLVEKAKALAPLLVGLISENTKSLFEQLKKDKERKNIDEKFGEVFFEMALFYLHFVDRIAFGHLGAEKRNIFMDALFIEFREVLSKVHESGIEAAQFRSAFAEAYNERQQEYGKYKKWFPEKDEGAKDTLFWEFGKKIAGIFGSEMDISVIMYVQTIVYSLTALQLPELFKE